MRNAKAFWLFSFFWASLLFALPENIKIPAFSAPVVDEKGLLSSSEKNQLDELLIKLQTNSKLQIAILITESLQDHDIESFAVSVFEKWQLGKKGEDRGLLWVIAPQERKMRLEVGYGLEGEITDAFSKHVLDDAAIPYFKKQRYFDGLVAGIQTICEKLKIDLQAPSIEKISGPDTRSHSIFITLLVCLFIAVILMQSFFGGPRSGYRSSRHNDWFGGGGFGGGSGGWGGGGGFGGGGGGSSGGGGASSSW